LDVYLKLNPTKARSKQELQELDKEYKRGEQVFPPRSYYSPVLIYF